MRVEQKAYNELSKEFLLDRLKHYVSIYGIPKNRDLDENKDYPSLSSYRKYFGNLKNALKECGIEYIKPKRKTIDKRKFTNEELLKILKEKTYEEIKKGRLSLLTNNYIALNNSMPPKSMYYNKFGGLKEAYKLIGIDYDSFNNELIEKDMKNKYLEIKRLCGQVPHSRILDKYSKMDNNRYYATKTYSEHFGSINNLQILMGDIPTNYSKNMTDEEMLNGLIKLKEELRIVPVQKEVEICDYCGSINDYSKRFGSFVEAIYKAGMTPRSEKKVLRTEKGNLALSGYEFKFLKFLESYDINFDKEEMYKKYIKNFNKRYKFDFTLHINNKVLFIEIFGITGNKNYDNKTKEKIQLCKDNNLNLLALYPKDIINNNFEQMIEIINNKLNER